MKLNCKYCGAQNNVYEMDDIATCTKCKHRFILPNNREEKFIKEYERGDFFLRKHYFDKAFSIYEKLLNSGNENDPAVLWSLMQAQFGFGYEKVNGKEKLYIHKLSFIPLKAPGTFHYKAFSVASVTQKSVMEEETTKIVDAYRSEMNSTRQQPPYDVYITCREKGFSGGESMEHKMAVKLYDNLTKLGYTVFSPEVTSEEMSHGEREPLVFAATNMAKVMIVLGSKPEAFSDVWVKSAWTRFLEVLHRGAKKLIIPCYMNIEAYELPDELFPFKSFDFSKEGALEAIIKDVNAFALPSSSPVQSIFDDEVKESRETEKVEEVKTAEETEKVVKVVKIEDKPQTVSEEVTKQIAPQIEAVVEESDSNQITNNNLRYVGLGHHKYRAGELVGFGSYPQDDPTGELKELITWRVLHVTSSKMLLISDNVLDCLPFSKAPQNVLEALMRPSKGTNWEKSDLRAWLNNGFLNNAFNDYDRSIILDSASIVGNDSDDICYDLVFCLSIPEVKSYMKNIEYRKARTTAYAKAKGAYKNSKGNSWWWLRSPGDNPSFAAGVDAEGEVFSFGVDVSAGRYGVRPAVWVSID